MVRSSKRRSWTRSDVRTLKTLARRKTRAVKSLVSEAHRRCYPAKGVQHWIIARFTSGLISGYSLHKEKPRHWRGFFDGPVEPMRGLGLVSYSGFEPMNP